jgi:FtsZ-binding cell division protein ZapB
LCDIVQDVSSTINVQTLDTISLLLVSIESLKHVESDKEKEKRKEGKERNEE